MTIYEVDKLLLIIKSDVENVRGGVVWVQSLLEYIRIDPNIEVDQLI